MDSTYSQGEFIDGPDTDNVIFYKREKFEYLSHTPIHTALRNISKFKLVHRLSKDTLIVFSVHLKAGNTTSDRLKRTEEVNILRNITKQLKPTDFFIVCGDFNIYNANEQAYINLTAIDSTANSHFVDPIYLPGKWNNPNYAQHHTQSTRTRQFGGGAFGGLDDRFDMILYSQTIAQPGGITYIEYSLWPVGNDGNHYKDSINAPPNSSVSQYIADCLHYASDHLPVISKFVFENRTLEIQLMEGWNSISLPLMPNETDLVAITTKIGDEFITLKSLNQEFYPSGGITTITEWNYAEGYFIKMADDATFEIQCRKPETTQINLREGWNLIPILKTEPVPLTSIIGDHLNNVIIVKEAIGTKVFWPEMQVTDLQSFEPERSYLIKSNGSFTITFD